MAYKIRELGGVSIGRKEHVAILFATEKLKACALELAELLLT